MALVFIDVRDLETAVAAREAVLADGHDIRMVESPDEIDGRLDSAGEVALFVTSDPGGAATRAMIGLFNERIPRPPVIGFAKLDADARLELARRLELDECLASPPDPDEVRVVLAQQLERYDLQLESGIVGRSEPVRAALERVATIARTGATVMITGESGTGKELVARALHRLSPRRGKAFIPVNSAALPESLLESELFGHEKGAFTGASSLRRGLFELADAGTIFLDEVAEMPPTTQTRLLRVLESRRFMRVGGDHEIEVNVRVIAATNRDLEVAVATGDFRRDLFYRLNVLLVHLPPLRARREDIPVLVRRFIDEFGREHDREFKGLAPEAMRILLEYDWPGNVRELRNLVESMVVLAPGTLIRPEDIPAPIREGRRATMPVPAFPASGDLATSDPATRPRMEFIFRTLLELKLDVEDLRREFERYKHHYPELLPAGAEIELPEYAAEYVIPDEAGSIERGEVTPLDGSVTMPLGVDGRPTRGGDDAHGATFTFRAGMTMADLEREAIIATLRETSGNRRRAAEKLQIGERTLYRKLKEYEIEL